MTMAFDFKKIFACQKMLTGAPHLEIQAIIMIMWQRHTSIVAHWHLGKASYHQMITWPLVPNWWTTNPQLF
jgi:hypothetical protein